jgi:hypothetical protein
VAQIALAKEPFEVTVAGSSDASAAKGRFFAAVSHGVGFVALLAMFFVDEGAGRDGFGSSGERIGARMVFCGNAVPMRGSCGAEEQG